MLKRTSRARYRLATFLLAALFACNSLHVSAQSQASPSAPEKSSTQNAKEKQTDITFDDLLAAGSYAMYGEARNLNQINRAMSDLTEPVRAYGGATGNDPASQLVQLFSTTTRLSADFYKEQETTLEGARSLFAGLAMREGLPESITAIELASTDAAEKFAAAYQKFNDAQAPKIAAQLNALQAQATPQSGNAAKPTNDNDKSGGKNAETKNADVKSAEAKKPSVPQSYFKRIGSLVIISDQPLKLEALRPPNSLPLRLDPNFQQARNQMANDMFFFYYDIELFSRKMKMMQEKIERERAAKNSTNNAPQAAERARQETATKNTSNAPAQTADEPSQSFEITEVEPPPPMAAPTNAKVSVDVANSPSKTSESANTIAATGEIGAETNAALSAKEKNANDTQNSDDARAKQPPPPAANAQAVSIAFPSLLLTTNLAQASMPAAVGVGASIQDEALAVRVLVINGAGAQPALIPFFPMLQTGAPISAAPSPLAPSDADIIIRASLDTQRIFANMLGMMSASPRAQKTANSNESKPTNSDDLKPNEQLAALEKLLGFSIKDDLLPALGNEVTIALPASYLIGSHPNVKKSADATNASSSEKLSNEKPTLNAPVAFISLNDADKIRTILPRLLPFLGAAQKEIYNDAELNITPSGAFAVLDNALIAASDVTSLKAVLDARREGRTLDLSNDFVQATTWQPRAALAQVYVSKDLLKRYFDGERAELELFDETAKDFLAHFNREPKAITYAATSDGANFLHEARIPKSVIQTFIAQTEVSLKQLPMRNNETVVRINLQNVYQREEAYFKKNNRYLDFHELNDKETIKQVEEARKQALGEVVVTVNGATLQSSGYNLNVTVTGDDFEITAVPKEYGKTGKRSYFIDKSGVLRGADHKGKPATADDPPIEQE